MQLIFVLGYPLCPILSMTKLVILAYFDMVPEDPTQSYLSAVP